ncbi:MAG: translation initiation factor IF-6 [Euryarchaeota archaeon]|nr:translation initiation factor IF-6 [Euryarchaeota archaeon]
MLVQLEILGSPYLGVFSRASERMAVAPPNLTEEALKEFKKALDVDVLQFTLGGSQILGAAVAMNSHGAVIADFGTAADTKLLTRLGLKVMVLGGTRNAAGNNILVNDLGGLVNPEVEDELVAEISRTLEVPCLRGTIAGLNTVGSAAIATNKGVLCHPKITPEEIDVVEAALQVPAEIGTVNRGAPFVGAGLVANSRGAAIGRLTTGPELNRIEDALGYI